MTAAIASGLDMQPTGASQSALCGTSPSFSLERSHCARGLVTVVQAALIGSILAKRPLDPGAGHIRRGLRHGTQRFSAEVRRMVSLFLLLSVAVLVILTVTTRLHLPAPRQSAPSN